MFEYYLRVLILQHYYYVYRYNTVYDAVLSTVRQSVNLIIIDLIVLCNDRLVHGCDIHVAELCRNWRYDVDNW